MLSEATVQDTIEWWDGTMSTRLNDAKNGAFINVQQRLAENDLTGHILETNNGEWTHLCLPMEYDPERSFHTSIGWKDPRTEPGELLWPERFGQEEVATLKKRLGPYRASGQLQQSPSPKGGGIIKREWWQLWDQDKFPPMEYILAVLDTAHTEKQENDPSAMTVWGVFSHDPAAQVSRVVRMDGRPLYADRSEPEGPPKVILMAAWAERLSINELVTKVNQTCRQTKVDKLIIENKAVGYSVSQELRRLFANELYSVQLVDPGRQDKWARLYAVQNIFAEQMVFAPDRAWADKVITEVALFPKAKHDDLTDTTSMGLGHLRSMGLLTRAQERLDAIETSKMFQGRPVSPLYPC
jgi:predicted phage terminase large subunit-like protein